LRNEGVADLEGLVPDCVTQCRPGLLEEAIARERLDEALRDVGQD
jgi:hypothetical protein